MPMDFDESEFLRTCCDLAYLFPRASRGEKGKKGERADAQIINKWVSKTKYLRWK